MHRILILPDIRPDFRLIHKPDTGYPAGYPEGPDTGYPVGYPVSGLTGYPAGQSGIRPDIKKAGLSGRPDIRCIPIENPA
jgi:hypothetical protein